MSSSLNNLENIASTVALTRELFSMKSVAAIKSVLDALGVALNEQSLKAVNFNFSILKQFQYDCTELKVAGFHAAALKAADFDLAALRRLK